MDKFKDIKNKISLEPIHSSKDSDIWNDLEKNILEEGLQVSKKRAEYTWSYIMVAASILVIAAGVGFWWIQNRGMTPSELVEDKSSPAGSGEIQQLVTVAEDSTINRIEVLEKSVVTEKDQGNSTSNHNNVVFEKNAYTRSIVASNRPAHFVLEDGSSVWLAPGARLEYNDTYKSKREVRLLGDAYFEVQHLKKEMPFKVFAMGTHFTVLGTKFYVNATGDINNICVQEGAVNVYDVKKDAFGVVMGGECMNISQTQIVRLEPNSMVPAWQKRILVFKDTPLKEVFEAIDFKFKIKTKVDANVQSCRFTGDVDTQKLEEVIDFIKLTTQVEIVKQNEIYRVSGKHCE